MSEDMSCHPKIFPFAKTATSASETRPKTLNTCFRSEYLIGRVPLAQYIFTFIMKSTSGGHL